MLAGVQKRTLPVAPTLARRVLANREYRERVYEKCGFVCLGSGFKWNFSSGFCERIPRPTERLSSRNRERLAWGAGAAMSVPARRHDVGEIGCLDGCLMP